MLKIEAFQRPDWTPLPFDGCNNVSAKALQRFPHIAFAMLRFEPNGNIHEHPAEIEIDVYCLEGEGMVSVGDEQAPFKAGQRVRWMAGVNHKLWTTDNHMVTLMVEHQNIDE